MKQIFLFLIGIMLCGVVNAQTYYDILIAGADLTSDNSGAINNDNFPELGLTSGTMSYDHSTKTFTLNGVNANPTDCFIEITEFAAVANYKINLIGNNVIFVGPTASIFTYRNLSIEGSGTLKVTSLHSYGICIVNKKTLTIKNTTVEFIGEENGIVGDLSHEETLVIENSYVKATGNTYGSISDFKNINLIGCTITQPAGAVVADNGSNGKAIMLGGSVVKTEVVIQPISYGIQIAGTDLTSGNVGAINNENFPNLGITSGTITYNHDAKTFTLDGVNASVSSGNFIHITSSAENVEYKINLIGNNVIANETTTIAIYRNLIIEGDGSLKLTANSLCGIYVGSNRVLTINNTTVETIGGRWGVAGGDGTSGEKLIIEKSNVKATGSDGSISDLQNITLNNCVITKPVGAEVGNNGSNGQAVMLGGAVVTSEVVIEPKTGIDNVESGLTFSIYPNPASNIINIVAEKTNELITISDLSGKIVHSEKASEKQSSINISQLSVGMYIVRIGNAEAKFVKE